MYIHASIVKSDDPKLNADILETYMKYLTNKRMTAIGFEPIFGKTDNPISWIKNWTDSKDVQVAPQETNITAYIVGGLKMDVTENSFKGFEL